MKGKKKCEYCQNWTDDTTLHRVEGKLIQLCKTCAKHPSPSGYQVECGDLREFVRDAANERDAAVKAIGQSSAENLSQLLRVRKRPVGGWGYFDTLALANQSEDTNVPKQAQ